MLVVHREHPFPGLIDLPQQFRELPKGVGAKHQVHMAVGLLHPLAHPLLLGHAPAQADDLLRVLLLRVGQKAQVAEHPLLGVLPHGAGIQDDQVGLLGVLRKGEAARLQHSH